MRVRPLSKRQKARLVSQDILLQGVLPEDGCLLDLGTEYGHTGRAVREAFPKVKLIGVEVHKETYLTCAERSEEHDTYNVLIHAEAMQFLRETQDRWDVVIAAEIIEHFSKKEGFELLELLKGCCDVAIVTSPIGFMRQGAMHNNPYQRHVSGWAPEEFLRAGYKTYALFDKLSIGIYTHGDIK